MVGCFQRKSTGVVIVSASAKDSHKNNPIAGSKPKTGLFHRRSADDYVVLWQGREICSYQCVADFIDAHEQGLQALEASQDQLLESFYKPL